MENSDGKEILLCILYGLLTLIIIFIYYILPFCNVTNPNEIIYLLFCLMC